MAPLAPLWFPAAAGHETISVQGCIHERLRVGFVAAQCCGASNRVSGGPEPPLWHPQQAQDAQAIQRSTTVDMPRLGVPCQKGWWSLGLRRLGPGGWWWCAGQVVPSEP